MTQDMFLNSCVSEMEFVSVMKQERVPARRQRLVRSAPPAPEDISVSPSPAERAAPSASALAGPGTVARPSTAGPSW